MPIPWTPQQVEAFRSARVLEITTSKSDGSFRPWVPIWVVCVHDSVYVRTWYRRSTGWFGHAVQSGRARVRVPGLDAEVDVEDVGSGSTQLRSAIDDAYRTKYGSVGSMATDSAASTTLRLSRVAT